MCNFTFYKAIQALSIHCSNNNLKNNFIEEKLRLLILKLLSELSTFIPNSITPFWSEDEKSYLSLHVPVFWGSHKTTVHKKINKTINNSTMYKYIS